MLHVVVQVIELGFQRFLLEITVAEVRGYESYQRR